MFTYGSRTEQGAVGYSVVRKDGLECDGVKSHMGYNQEAFDAGCAAIVRALKLAVMRLGSPGRVLIISDAQAAIRRMASEEPGPGQANAIEERRWIMAIWRANSAIAIEIRWCPAHKGVTGDKADEWPKVAAEEPDTWGVEWLRTANGAAQQMLPRSLANFKREISEKKWAEARKGGRQDFPEEV